MDVKCEKCQARYRIDDARVGPAGLTMRCGKCGNTFKVTKGGATQAVGAAASSAPPPAAKAPTAAPSGPAPESSTMMFAAPVLPKAPAAGKPAPAATKPPPGRPADDGAGSTMMFAVAPVAPAKPAPAKPPPAASRPSESDAGSTMMFAAAPVVAAKTDASNAAKAKKPSPARDEGAGSTMMFAAAPQPQPLPKAPPAPIAQHPATPEMLTEPGAPPDEEPAQAAAQDEPEPQAEQEPEPMEQVAPQSRPLAAIAPMAREEQPEDHGIVAEGAEHTQDAPLVPQQRKFPVVPVAIAAALLVIALLALGAVKLLRKQLPTADAISQMADAHTAALKDTPVDYASAEAQAKASLQINKRAFFPIGYAELAEIEIGWADALQDLAAPEADIKTRRAAALDAINRGLKIDDKNVDLSIAQADYYRSANARGLYAKSIKRALALAANDDRVAFVQGMAAGAEEEGFEKALPLLKAAAAALPTSARVRYRYAQQLAAAKQGDAAIKELEAVLKISPTHQRAKKLLEDEQGKKGK